MASHGLSPMRRCTMPAFRRRAPAGAGVSLLVTYVNDGPAPRCEDVPRVRREDGSIVRKLKTRPLAPDGIAQAFPLIQLAFPEVTLEEWRDFASPLAPRAGCTRIGPILDGSD